MRLTQHAGPLPPPEVLAEYERAIPGVGQEIVRAFTEERQHRHDLERKRDASFRDLEFAHIETVRRGMRYGLTVALAALGVTAFAAAKGQAVVAAIVGSVDIVGLVAVFVLGRRLGSAEPSAQPEPPQLQAAKNPEDGGA